MILGEILLARWVRRWIGQISVIVAPMLALVRLVK
jgi:hypothetical protein